MVCLEYQDHVTLLSIKHEDEYSMDLFTEK